MTTRLLRWLSAITLRTFAVFGIAIVASVGFVVLAAEVRNGAVDQLDISIAWSIHRLDAPAWDVLMKGATLIGTSVILLPALGLAMLLAIRRGRRAAAVILIVDAVVAIVVNNLLKLVFSRARPTLFDKIPMPADYAFPSGHAMSAMAIWGAIAAVLILLYPRAKVPLVVGAVVLIAAVGFSRIYLGVHWPFDVVGGFLGGIPPLAVTVHLLHRSQRAVHDRSLADLVADDDPGA